jgi:hypothetical protein
MKGTFFLLFFLVLELVAQDEVVKENIEEKVTVETKEKRTDKEKELYEKSSVQVLCQGCMDKTISSILNEVGKTVDSTGNRIDLENGVVQDVLAQVLIDELKKLAVESKEGETLSESYQQKLQETLRLMQTMVLDKMARKIHEIKNRGKNTEEDQRILNKFLTRLEQIHERPPLSKFWKEMLEKHKMRTLAKELKKMNLQAEYYINYIKAPKRRYVALKVKVYDGKVANTEHTERGVQAYLFGDDRDIRGKNIGGVIRQFDLLADSFEKKIEDKRKLEERLERQKEIRAERDERIDDGEILSEEMMKKAKWHHERYMKYYNEMVQKCRMSYFNRIGCQRATNNFYRIGKNIHLRKMFEYAKIAKQDQEVETKTKVAKYQEEYMNSDPEGYSRDYALLDSQVDNGELGDRLPQSQEPWMGDSYYLSGRPTTGGSMRSPTGMNQFGPYDQSWRYQMLGNGGMGHYGQISPQVSPPNGQYDQIFNNFPTMYGGR